jgi:hypothetical protein
LVAGSITVALSENFVAVTMKGFRVAGQGVRKGIRESFPESVKVTKKREEYT